MAILPLLAAGTALAMGHMLPDVFGAGALIHGMAISPILLLRRKRLFDRQKLAQEAVNLAEQRVNIAKDELASLQQTTDRQLTDHLQELDRLTQEKNKLIRNQERLSNLKSKAADRPQFSQKIENELVELQTALDLVEKDIEKAQRLYNTARGSGHQALAAASARLDEAAHVYNIRTKKLRAIERSIALNQSKELAGAPEEPRVEESQIPGPIRKILSRRQSFDAMMRYRAKALELSPDATIAAISLALGKSNAALGVFLHLYGGGASDFKTWRSLGYPLLAGQRPEDFVEPQVAPAAPITEPPVPETALAVAAETAAEPQAPKTASEPESPQPAFVPTSLLSRIRLDNEGSETEKQSLYNPQIMLQVMNLIEQSDSQSLLGVNGDTRLARFLTLYRRLEDACRTKYGKDKGLSWLYSINEITARRQIERFFEEAIRHPDYKPVELPSRLDAASLPQVPLPRASIYEGWHHLIRNYRELYRDAEGSLTPRELARRADIALRRMGEFESGKSRPTRLEAEKLQKVLGFDLSDAVNAFGLEADPTPKLTRMESARHALESLFGFGSRPENETRMDSDEPVAEMHATSEGPLEAPIETPATPSLFETGSETVPPAPHSVPVAMAPESPIAPSAPPAQQGTRPPTQSATLPAARVSDPENYAFGYVNRAVQKAPHNLALAYLLLRKADQHLRAIPIEAVSARRRDAIAKLERRIAYTRDVFDVRHALKRINRFMDASLDPLLEELRLEKRLSFATAQTIFGVTTEEDYEELRPHLESIVWKFLLKRIPDAATRPIKSIRPREPPAAQPLRKMYAVHYLPSSWMNWAVLMDPRDKTQLDTVIREELERYLLARASGIDAERRFHAMPPFGFYNVLSPSKRRVFFHVENDVIYIIAAEQIQRLHHNANFTNFMADQKESLTTKDLPTYLRTRMRPLENIFIPGEIMPPSGGQSVSKGPLLRSILIALIGSAAVLAFNHLFLFEGSGTIWAASVVGLSMPRRQRQAIHENRKSELDYKKDPHEAELDRYIEMNPELAKLSNPGFAYGVYLAGSGYLPNSADRALRRIFSTPLPENLQRSLAAINLHNAGYSSPEMARQLLRLLRSSGYTLQTARKWQDLAGNICTILDPITLPMTNKRYMQGHISTKRHVDTALEAWQLISRLSALNRDIPDKPGGLLEVLQDLAKQAQPDYPLADANQPSGWAVVDEMAGALEGHYRDERGWQVRGVLQRFANGEITLTETIEALADYLIPPLNDRYRAFLEMLLNRISSDSTRTPGSREMAAIQGGAASFASELTREQRWQIQRVIERFTGSPVRIDTDGLDSELARRVEETDFTIVPELAEFDDILIAHAGVTGDAFSVGNRGPGNRKAIYFSPRGFGLYQRLSRAAQIELLKHEILGHLDQPTASEIELRARYPLDRVTLEAALMLVDEVQADRMNAALLIEKVHGDLKDQMYPGARSETPRLLVISALIRGDEIDLDETAEHFRTHGDPAWATVLERVRLAHFPNEPRRRAASQAMTRRRAAAAALLQEFAPLNNGTDNPALKALTLAHSSLIHLRVNARNACLLHIYGRDVPSEKQLVADLRRRIAQFGESARLPLEGEPEMRFAYRLLERLRDDAQAHMESVRRRLKSRPRAPEAERGRPLFDRDTNAPKPSKQDDPELIELFAQQRVAQARLKLIKELITALAADALPHTTKLRSARSFAYEFHMVFRRNRTHTSQALRRDPMIVAIGLLAGLQELPGVPEEKFSQKHSRRWLKALENKQLREPALLLMAFDVLPRLDFIRLLRSREGSWVSGTPWSSASREQALSALTSAFKIHPSGSNNPLRKLGSLAPIESETPEPPPSPPVRPARDESLFQDQSVEERRARVAKMEGNDSHRDKLLAQRPLLEALSHALGFKEEEIVDHLLPHVGQPMDNGFFAVNILRGIIRAYQGLLVRAEVHLGDDMSWERTDRVHFVFEPNTTVTIEERFGHFEVTQTPTEKPNGKTVVVERPNVIKMQKYLDHKHLAGSPVLYDHSARLAHQPFKASAILVPLMLAGAALLDRLHPVGLAAARQSASSEAILAAILIGASVYIGVKISIGILQLVFHLMARFKPAFAEPAKNLPNKQRGRRRLRAAA